MALTEKDLMKIQEAMREQESDTTPFAIIDGEGGVSVIGDPNKTEIKHYDYTVRFRIPSQFVDEGTGNKIVNGKYTVVELEYKDVTISARKDLQIVACLNDLRPFLVEVLPDGESKDRDEDELKKIITNLITKQSIINAMYNLVGTVVGVKEELIPMMLYDSVFENVVKIIRDFPEIINEEDFFTGGQSLRMERTKNE